MALLLWAMLASVVASFVCESLATLRAQHVSFYTEERRARPTVGFGEVNQQETFMSNQNQDNQQQQGGQQDQGGQQGGGQQGGQKPGQGGQQQQGGQNKPGQQGGQR
jgi:hypothetical protein